MYLVILLLTVVRSSNYIYDANTIGMSWSDANTYCESEYGTHLAVVTSKEENDIAFNLCDNPYCYIGFYYDINKFKWFNGNNLGYTNWASLYPDYPNAVDQSCGALHNYQFDEETSGTWVHSSCHDNSYASLCQAPDGYEDQPSNDDSSSPWWKEPLEYSVGGVTVITILGILVKCVSVMRKRKQEKNNCNKNIVKGDNNNITNNTKDSRSWYICSTVQKDDEPKPVQNTQTKAGY